MNTKKQDLTRKPETSPLMKPPNEVDNNGSPPVEDEVKRDNTNKFATRRQELGNFLNKRINKDDSSKAQDASILPQ